MPLIVPRKSCFPWLDLLSTYTRYHQHFGNLYIDEELPSTVFRGEGGNSKLEKIVICIVRTFRETLLNLVTFCRCWQLELSPSQTSNDRSSRGGGRTRIARRGFAEMPPETETDFADGDELVSAIGTLRDWEWSVGEIGGRIHLPKTRGNMPLLCGNKHKSRPGLAQVWEMPECQLLRKREAVARSTSTEQNAETKGPKKGARKKE